MGKRKRHEQGSGRKTKRGALFAICIALALMVWAVFGQTIRHGFVNYDDDAYVYKNPDVSQGLTRNAVARVFTRSYVSNWHPVTMLSYLLDYEVDGLNPSGFHRTNVLLHMASAMALFLVLRSMTGSLWRSAFVAALFAIHPLRVESVAWIAERKDVLSGLFFMLTLGAYVRYVHHPFSVGRYLPVLLLFALGMMSKPMLVTLPFVLLLLDFWPLKRFPTTGLEKSITRQLVLEKVPFFALSALFCAITVWAQEVSIMTVDALPMPWRLANAAVVYIIYMGQTVFPADLAVFYPHQGTELPVWKVGVSLVFLAGISLAVFIKRKKRPYLLTGWLWYLGMLVPVVGIMQVGQQAHADRYTYLPQIGLGILAIWLLGEWVTSRYRQIMASVVAGMVLVGLATAARIQTVHWRDSISLWTHTLDCTTESSVAHCNLGVVFAEQKKHAEAIWHCEQAIRINPNYAEAHSNLGVALAAQGNQKEAMRCYQEALRNNPNFAKAHCNLGNIFARRGDFAEAIPHYEQALQINPDYFEAHYNLGNALSDMGKHAEAIPHYRQVLRINPDYPARNALTQTLALGKQTAKAARQLGLKMQKERQFAAAIWQYKKALQLNPDYLGAKNNLAWLLATCPDAALRDGKRAVKLAKQVARLIGSEHPSALDTLAAAYAEAGRYAEAAATAQRALDAADQEGVSADNIRKRLKLYQASTPYHEK